MEEPASNIEGPPPQQANKQERSNSNSKGRNRGGNRATKGVNQQRNNNDRLDNSLFKIYGGIRQYVLQNQFQITPQARAIKIPITTRGIGILIHECALKFTRAHQNIEVPILPLYRTGLAMAEYKAIHSQLTCPMLASSGSVPVVPDYNMYQLLRTSSIRHLTPIVNLVDAIGTFKVHDTTYIPSMVGKSVGTIGISSLRNYVTDIANPATPQVVRTSAYNYNPISQARFDREGDGFVLNNPDEIMPADYNHISLAADINEVDAYFMRMGRKIQAFDAVWKMKDTGLSSQLVTCDPQLYIRPNADDEDVETHGDVVAWWSPEPVQTVDYISGMVHLLGENHADYHPRHASLSCSQLTASWKQTVLALLSV